MSPSDADILKVLERLDQVPVDDLETAWLEIKPWTDARDDMRIAAEYAVCFANAGGGVVVFGIRDRTVGRAAAIHGSGKADLDVWRRGIYDGTQPHLEVEVYELAIPEGTQKLLLVRVPKGTSPPYGTAQGVFKRRVGKNCMPLDAQSFAHVQVSAGVVDWSGRTAVDAKLADLDPVEIARGRDILRRAAPDSDLLRLGDKEFLAGLEATRDGRPTHAGLVLFGRQDTLRRLCPQNQVHYVQLQTPTDVVRNDNLRAGLLNILEQIERNFSGPANPEQELPLGFIRLRIPAFPIEAVREAVLNAVTHRDYLDPNEVLVRHEAHELIVTSPGDFIGGVTPQNILRHEPVSRNRLLAEILQKLRLVERAGVGRRRIFETVLRFGKRPPVFESDGHRVTLRIRDGSFDKKMAALVAQWAKDGREINLDGLLVLTYLREHAFIDSEAATALLQASREEVGAVLDRLAQPGSGLLERKGGPHSSTYHLTKAVTRDLLGKAAYTRTKGIDPARYAELVRSYINDFGSISPKECRELLGLGGTNAAQVEMSRLFRKWMAKGGFLRRVGKPPQVRYHLRDRS
jgi:ATP-dependent DNA helicase RecG